MRNSMRSSVPARAKPHVPQHSLAVLASSRPEFAMSGTVIDLTLSESDDAGDSPYSPMSDFGDVSANQQAGECSDLAGLVSEPVDTACVLISDDSSLLDSR